MEIIESFQAFENLDDRTFRGRSLGYQDEYEPEVDVAERSNAWRMRRTLRGPRAVVTDAASIGVQHDVSYRPDARTMSAMAQSLPNRCITANYREVPNSEVAALIRSPRRRGRATEAAQPLPKLSRYAD